MVCVNFSEGGVDRIIVWNFQVLMGAYAELSLLSFLLAKIWDTQDCIKSHGRRVRVSRSPGVLLG